MKRNEKILFIFMMIFFGIVLMCVFLQGFMKYREKREKKRE